MSDFLALARLGCRVIDELDVLEVGLVSIGYSCDSAGALMVGDEFDDWS